MNGVGKPLLGCRTRKKLGILKFGEEANSLNQKTENIIRNHSELFMGIGKLKNHQTKLHIKPDMKPVAHNYRRIH